MWTFMYHYVCVERVAVCLCVYVCVRGGDLCVRGRVSVRVSVIHIIEFK